jgi:tRNA(fMet)-specific endonuclease VapC
MILDTNALSAFADGDEALLPKLRECPRLYLPVIVLGEFTYGIRQSRYRRTYERWLKLAEEHLEVLPVLRSTAEHYAALVCDLRKAGTPIPTNDAWIAALAREHRLPIVSRDRHFDLIAQLERVDW